jgi:hypothetical protein
MIDPSVYDRMVPPGTPEPWLAVIDPGTEDYVIEVAANIEELDLPALDKRMVAWLDLGHKIFPVQDDPSLKVCFQGGALGLAFPTPAKLAARRNWFLRYRAILEPHLRDPQPAGVLHYKRGTPTDLFASMRSTAAGPFPYPRHARSPVCNVCDEATAFVGVLDFREYAKFGNVRGVPNGSLVLHFCTECFEPAARWIGPGDSLELRGNGNAERIEAGILSETIEFPTPAIYAEELSSDPAFNREWGIYYNFAMTANKIGGHIFWIQRIEGDGSPIDSKGQPMRFIGQFLCPEGGSIDGVIYVFFSEATGETKTVLQYD